MKLGTLYLGTCTVLIFICYIHNIHNLRCFLKDVFALIRAALTPAYGKMKPEFQTDLHDVNKASPGFI